MSELQAFILRSQKTNYIAFIVVNTITFPVQIHNLHYLHNQISIWPVLLKHGVL